MKKNLKSASTTSCGANSWDTEYDIRSAFQAATQWGPTKYVQGKIGDHCLVHSFQLYVAFLLASPKLHRFNQICFALGG